IANEAIPESIDGIARADHRLMNHRELRGWNHICRLLESSLPDVCVPRDQPGLRKCRSACDDAVIISWETLGLDQRLTTAKGASIPIGELRIGVVERVDNHLRFDRHLVYGSIREIHQLLGMAKERGRCVADVTRIGRGCRVATLERLSHA